MRSLSTKYLLLVILIFGFLIRVISSIIFVDFNNPEMWEFGIIARSLLNDEGYVFIAHTQNVVSAFMPPGLPYFYYGVFRIFGDNVDGFFIILVINSILSSISIFLVYNLTNIIFNKQIALYSSILVCLSPIYIFSTINFNSIIFYHVLILLTLTLFYRLYFNINNIVFCNIQKDRINALLLGLTLGLFLYFRAEVLIFIILASAYLLFKRKYLNTIIIISSMALVISPWVTRNYIEFGKIIPITTSFGYNFFTGHSDVYATDDYIEKISSLKEDSSFELIQSDIAKKLAINYILTHPKEELIESFKKIYSLWIIDYYRDSAKNPLYLIAWFPILISFCFGTFFIFKDKLLYPKLLPIYIFFLLSTIIIIVFFNIPRYQIQMSILIIPISIFGFLKIFPKIKSTIK